MSGSGETAPSISQDICVVSTAYKRQLCQLSSKRAASEQTELDLFYLFLFISLYIYIYHIHPYLAYTRYCFVFGPLCTNQYYSLRTHALFRHPSPPRHRPHNCALYCFPPTPRYCNVYHTILVMAISCKGQIRTCVPSAGHSSKKPNSEGRTSACC